ncbi:MAG: 50S ribosomal protein L7/L12 [Chloroflexi bacterium]|jgi:large subunit ribosomal protein L7/L12|nr:MAG: 50S ribosomal protein L7/L12 [Chloroflexota bacterium]
MSDKLQKMVESLDQLTLIEAAELSKMLQEKWGVSAAAPVAMGGMPMTAAGPAEAVEEEEEKTEFDLTLKDVGPKKIQVIKAVRTFRPDLGLKEAKELVDSAPVKVLEGVPKDQAESAANALKEQDAVVEIA